MFAKTWPHFSQPTSLLIQLISVWFVGRSHAKRILLFFSFFKEKFISLPTKLPRIMGLIGLVSVYCWFGRYNFSISCLCVSTYLTSATPSRIDTCLVGPRTEKRYTVAVSYIYLLFNSTKQLCVCVTLTNYLCYLHKSLFAPWLRLIRPYISY